MQRREFLQHTATAAILPLSLKSSFANQAQDDYKLALEQADARVPAAIARQALEQNHRQRGGFIIDAYGFAYAGSTAGEIAMLGTVFCNQDSRYFHDKDLAERMALGMDYLEKAQHADGTIDLPTTNFHSPPDTAFALEELTLLYRLLKRDGTQSALLSRLEKFIRKAAMAVATGGIHTPNHRWVASAALAASYDLFKEPAYLRRIEAWLAEGIDCNADGEYTELSNGVYNRVTNRALLMIGEYLHRPDILEPLRRNLKMMMYCTHPDGEVVTDYSTRQDRNGRARLGGFYIPYRAMSLRDNDGQFAAMADWIATQARTIPKEISLGGDLVELMLRPELRTEKIVRQSLPVEFEKHFSSSGVARLQTKSFSATTVANSPRFFSFRHGKAVLEGVRVASAFFGKGQFVSAKLEFAPQQYKLRQHLSGPYYQPLTEGIPNPNWEALDRNKRPQSPVCQLDTTVSIRALKNGFEISVQSSGTDEVPLVIELWFRAGGKLSAEKDGELINVNGSNFLTSGFARYEFGGDVIRVGSGKAEHRWAQLRGADVPIADAIPLTIAGFTPFQHTVQILVA